MGDEGLPGRVAAGDGRAVDRLIQGDSIFARKILEKTRHRIELPATEMSSQTGLKANPQDITNTLVFMHLPKLWWYVIDQLYNPCDNSEAARCTSHIAPALYGNGISGRSHRLSGFDIIEACKSFEEDQIAARIGSQADLGFLDSVLAEFGPPDVVLPQRESRRR